MKKKTLYLLSVFLFFLTTLLSIPRAYALTPAGTVIGNAATATYYDENNNKYTTTSNIVQTVVQEVCSVDVSGGGNYQGVPGQTVYVPFTIKNAGNGENTFTLSTTGTYSKTIYLDENQNGIVDPGEPSITSVTLNMDETASIVVAVEVPTSATSGESDSFELKAESNSTGGCSDSQTAEVDVVADALIQTNKQVDKSSAVPGDTLTYTVFFQNVGTKAAKAKDGYNVDIDDNGNVESGVEGILVYDQIPTGSTFINGSASGQPANGYVVYSPDGTNWYKSESQANSNGGIEYVGFFLSDENPTDDIKGDVLDPDQEGSLTFKVTVNNPFDDSDGSVDNKATIEYDDSSGNDKSVTTNEVRTSIPSSATADIAISDRKTSISEVEKDNGTNWQDDNIASNVPAGSWVTFYHSAANRASNDDVINLAVDTANSSLPTGYIVEFWNADGSARLIDTDGDGKVDPGTVPANTTKDFVVKLFIPADTPEAPKDGNIDYYLTVIGSSGNNPAVVDLSRDNIDGIIKANVDIGKKETLTDTVNNPSDGNTDGTSDSDDVLPSDNGTNGIIDIVNPGEKAVYPLEIANYGGSPDQFSLSASGNPSQTAVKFYTDPNCDGDYSDGEQITNTPLLGGTSLTADSSAGDDTINVYSVAEISPGDKLIIGYGTDHAEVATVESVDVNTNEITLTSPLSHDHSQGENVAEEICIVMVVETSSDTPVGDSNIVITAESENSGAKDTMDAYLKVNPVCGITVSPDHSDQLPPGGTTTYTHIIENTGNIDANVTITVPSSGTQLSYVILDDAENPQGTELTISLSPGQTYEFKVKAIVPSDIAVGTVESLKVSVQADINNDSVYECSQTVTDTTTIIEGFLQLTKTATVSDTDGPDSVGVCTGSPDGIEGGPCDEITYHIQYKNIGSQNATEVVITDPIPAHTEYVPDSFCLDTNCDGTCDTTLTDGAGDDQAEYDSTDNLVRFRVGNGANGTQGGTIAPGEEGCIMFKVKIK